MISQIALTYLLCVVLHGKFRSRLIHVLCLFFQTVSCLFFNDFNPLVLLVETKQHSAGNLYHNGFY